MVSKNELKINREIKVSEARIIDQNGKMLGVLPIAEGLKLAFESGLDLVEVSPNANPVICKITSYSKMKYEEQKKANIAKKKQKIVDTKEVKLSLNIGENDFQIKLKQSIKFLENGDKVKFNFLFRGREITHSDSAQIIVNKILEATTEIAKLDEKPKLEGKKMYFILVPLK